jgi:hypothetical protein
MWWNVLNELLMSDIGEGFAGFKLILVLKIIL